MATWVTHLMIADQIMKKAKGLDRRGFCVGNIAPDCNVENEDWTSFIPSRETTHWMNGGGKSVSDGDLFYEEYMRKREGEIKSEEHRAFLAGYYSHLITDAVFQKFIRDENRVKAVWRRIYADEQLREKVKCYPEDWNSVRIIIPKNIRMAEINTIEAEYLKEHPDSGYLTEIIPLKEFPDYIDHLPHGCIVRKIRISFLCSGKMGRNDVLIRIKCLSWAEQSLDAVRIYPSELAGLVQKVQDNMDGLNSPDFTETL